MSQVTDEEKFLFDIQGFLILRGAIDRDLIEALDAAVVENEATEHDESWADVLPVVTAKHFIRDFYIENQVRLNGLPRLDPIFDQLIAHHPAHAEASNSAAGAGASLPVWLADGVLASVESASDAVDLIGDLHVVPEFLGNRAPFADPQARAIISGDRSVAVILPAASASSKAVDPVPHPSSRTSSVFFR